MKKKTQRLHVENLIYICWYESVSCIFWKGGDKLMTLKFLLMGIFKLNINGLAQLIINHICCLIYKSHTKRLTFLLCRKKCMCFFLSFKDTSFSCYHYFSYLSWYKLNWFFFCTLKFFEGLTNCLLSTYGISCSNFCVPTLLHKLDHLLLFISIFLQIIIW